MITIPRIKTNKKRLGRGYGSGKGGHTSSRGQKGQKSRRTIGIMFEGLKMKKSFVKRLPFMRGKAKFGAQPKPVTINLSDLVKFPKEEKIVSIESLIKSGLVQEKYARKNGVKVLGKGEIDRKLSFNLLVSESAALKIKKAGGEILAK